VYDYIEGTSALSEEQIKEGCEFLRGWLDDSSEGVDEEDISRTRTGTRTRIRILSPRNRPEDAFAIGLCYLAWAEKRMQEEEEEEVINVDPPSPVGPLSTSPFMFSASTTTTTTTVPISVPTLSIPVSFPSLASALSPAVTDYRSPTSPTTHGPGAARLRAHAHAPVRPTFMSRTTSVSTARPGGGVPPVTAAGLMARMASLGVNDVPGQDEDEANKVLDRKPSLRGLGLGHKLSLSTIDRKAFFRRAKERDARRRERNLRRKEREERRGARDKPVWKGLRDEWRGVLSFEGVQGLVGVWP